MAAETAPSPARDKALAVTELREAIIGQLPSKDVLLVQQVKTWNDTIKGSLMLQRALGFQPNGRSIDNTKTAFDVRPKLSYGMNAIEFLEVSTKSNAYIITPLLEILCEKKPLPSESKSLSRGKPSKVEFELLCVPDFGRKSVPAWERIFLTQPPTTEILINWQCECLIDDYGPRALITDDDDRERGPFHCRNKDGIKLTDLVQALESRGLEQCGALEAFCWMA